MPRIEVRADHDHFVLLRAARNLADDVERIDGSIAGVGFQVHRDLLGNLPLRQTRQAVVLLGGEDEGRRGQRIFRIVAAGGLGEEHASVRALVPGDHRQRSFVEKELVQLRPHAVARVEHLLAHIRWQGRHVVANLLRIVRKVDVFEIDVRQCVRLRRFGQFGELLICVALELCLSHRFHFQLRREQNNLPAELTLIRRLPCLNLRQVLLRIVEMRRPVPIGA